MVTPRHLLLLALGICLILALATANKPEESEKSMAIRPGRCSAGCEKPNKLRNKCIAYGGYCAKKRRKCGPGMKFNKRWCKGMCGCCYKEFEPKRCGQTDDCKARNGTFQDSRLDCNGGDMVNEYSDKDGCTCCIPTVKPLIDYNPDDWSSGEFDGPDGTTFLYTTAPYSWHSCASWCGEQDAAQANVTDLETVAATLNAEAPGHDMWTSGCGGISGCADFRPRYSPSVSCFNLKCSFHQGCLCVRGLDYWLSG